MVVKLLAFWARSEPRTERSGVSGSVSCAAYSASLRARLSLLLLTPLTLNP